jgi:hypothetical protein
MKRDTALVRATPRSGDRLGLLLLLLLLVPPPPLLPPRPGASAAPAVVGPRADSRLSRWT